MEEKKCSRIKQGEIIWYHMKTNAMMEHDDVFFGHHIKIFQSVNKNYTSYLDILNDNTYGELRKL